MKYYVSKSNDPHLTLLQKNIALSSCRDIDEIFLLWINEPTIVVGKYQNTIEEINTEYTREKGIHVVRRISGGGAVYHDLNNLNYTIISNKQEDKERL